ncbi:hypothetical protein [Lysinibacillus capsici]|nr:hypothetical protein [Lysinibacillus capsici]
MDLTGVDFTIILDEVKDMAKIAIPVVLAFIGFRKGYGFLKKQLKGA